MARPLSYAIETRLADVGDGWAIVSFTGERKYAYSSGGVVWRVPDSNDGETQVTDERKATAQSSDRDDSQQPRDKLNDEEQFDDAREKADELVKQTAGSGLGEINEDEASDSADNPADEIIPAAAKTEADLRNDEGSGASSEDFEEQITEEENDNDIGEADKGEPAAARDNEEQIVTIASSTTNSTAEGPPPAAQDDQRISTCYHADTAQSEILASTIAPLSIHHSPLVRSETTVAAEDTHYHTETRTVSVTHEAASDGSCRSLERASTSADQSNPTTAVSMPTASIHETPRAREMPTIGAQSLHSQQYIYHDQQAAQSPRNHSTSIYQEQRPVAMSNAAEIRYTSEQATAYEDHRVYEDESQHSYSRHWYESQSNSRYAPQAPLHGTCVPDQASVASQRDDQSSVRTDSSWMEPARSFSIPEERSYRSLPIREGDVIEYEPNAQKPFNRFSSSSVSTMIAGAALFALGRITAPTGAHASDLDDSHVDTATTDANASNLDDNPVDRSATICTTSRHDMRSKAKTRAKNLTQDSAKPSGLSPLVEGRNDANKMPQDWSDKHGALVKVRYGPKIEITDPGLWSIGLAAHMEVAEFIDSSSGDSVARIRTARHVFRPARRPRKFFVPGRVFCIAWPRSINNNLRADRNDKYTDFSEDEGDCILGPKDRWFVTLKAGKDQSTCLSITTDQVHSITSVEDFSTLRIVPNDSCYDTYDLENSACAGLICLPTASVTEMSELRPRVVIHTKLYTIRHDVSVDELGTLTEESVLRMEDSFNRVVEKIRTLN